MLQSNYNLDKQICTDLAEGTLAKLRCCLLFPVTKTDLSSVLSVLEQLYTMLFCSDMSSKQWLLGSELALEKNRFFCNKK